MLKLHRMTREVSEQRPERQEHETSRESSEQTIKDLRICHSWMSNDADVL